MVNRTREVIENLGLKKTEIAARMGITTVGLQQLLNTEKPKLGTLENLAKAIGVPTWKLILTDEEIKEIMWGKAKGAEINCPHCGNKLNIYLE